MLTVNVSEAGKYLNSIVRAGVKDSVMLWGAPGIGKSSVVNKVARDNEMEVVDLRLSQLAPTDIRGLPYVEGGLARFAPPSFLPRSGSGILFLDEINLAAPSIMATAMQLVLDRKVGDYTLPDGWFVISAGNRTEDRSAVSQMPAPLTNRFIHFTVEADLNSWKEYALTNGIKEEIISFLNFRPNLLHSFNKNATSWASPRSWQFASNLLKIGLPADPAVGEGVAAEFNSFVKLYSKLPDVEKVLAGDKSVKMPKEPSVIFAITGALVARSETAEHFFNGMMWLINASSEDYVGVYMSDSLVRMKSLGVQGAFVAKVTKSPEAKKFVSRYQDLLR
jgi:MoxR-like ATPase